MDKSKLYERIRSKIKSNISKDCFFIDELGFYDDYAEYSFSIEDMDIEVSLTIKGENEHKDDKVTGPYDRGKIYACVDHLEVWCGDEKVICEDDVYELLTTLKY